MKKGWINEYVICFVIMKIDVGYWSLSDLVVSFDQCMLVCVFMLK